MRRVNTLIKECVMTVCVPDVFHSSGSHGYAASSDGMSSWIVNPTTVLWLISPKVMWLVSSFEKRAHPRSFTNACLSRSSNFHRFLKICLLVVSSRNCFLLERRVSTALLHGPPSTAASISSLDKSNSALRSMMWKLSSAAKASVFRCLGLSNAFWRETI